MIAGFETPTSGKITVGGADVTYLHPSKRNVGMVFQAYALFPNMTVAENIGFGLKIAGKPASEILSRVEEMLAMIKLPHLAGRYPYQMSGGQQQRVALARAIAIRPQVLLLDEPLSALDAKIRVSLREEIRALQRQLGITTVFVTHDQEEALSISDRIVVMREGHADQVGAPPEIYNNPRTRFVASFVGTLNLFEATIVNPAAGLVEIDGQTVTTRRDVGTLAAGSKTTVALRPEALTLGTPMAGQNALTGKVEEVSFLGATVRVRVRLANEAVSLDMFNNPGAVLPQRGSAVSVLFAPDDLLVVAA